jgi:hypothetical protein
MAELPLAPHSARLKASINRESHMRGKLSKCLRNEFLFDKLYVALLAIVIDFIFSFLWGLFGRFDGKDKVREDEVES